MNLKGKIVFDNKIIKNKFTRYIVWSMEFVCVLFCFVLKLGLLFLNDDCNYILFLMFIINDDEYLINVYVNLCEW